jgi:hypothetical protein
MVEIKDNKNLLDMDDESKYYKLIQILNKNYYFSLHIKHFQKH